MEVFFKETCIFIKKALKHSTFVLFIFNLKLFKSEYFNELNNGALTFNFFRAVLTVLKIIVLE